MALTSEQARELAAKRTNPGRRPRTEEEEIKKALRKAIPETEVCDRLADLCRKKSLPAIALYLAYLWGKPIERSEISGPGGDVLEIIYTDNWRNDTPAPPPGAADSPAEPGPLSLVDGRPSLAQDDNGSGDCP